MAKPTLLGGAIFAAYAIACFVLVVPSSAYDGVASLVFIALIYLWMLLPNALLCFANFSRPFLALGAVIVGGHALYVYWRAFYGPDPDPQSGLMLIFWPIYQLGFAGMFLLVGFGASKVFTKHDRR